MIFETHPAREMRVVATLVVVAASLVGCSNPTEPVLAGLSVRLTHQRIGPLGELDVTMSVRIANTTSETIYFSSCSTALERHDDSGRWEFTGGVLCAMPAYENPLHGMLSIPVGTSRELPVTIRVRGEFGADDSGSGYRLRLMVAIPKPISRQTRSGNELTIQSLTSNEFTLAPS